MNDHVTDIDIARFRAGQLDRARIEAVGAHVRGCPACAARVFGSSDVRAAAEAVKRNATERPHVVRWLVAAAALLVIVVAAAWLVLQARRGEPQRSPVVALHPASPHPWDAQVADALQRGEIAPPAWLADLRRGGEDVVRGPEADVNYVRLLGPSGAGVETQTPLLRWTPAVSCVVTIARDGNVVAKSGRITGASCTPPPLARDATYEWQLTLDDGRHVPPPEHPPARFRVLSADDARRLADVRATGDRTATGIVAAQLGVVDEAIADLSESSDPRAQALAKKIRAW